MDKRPKLGGESVNFDKYDFIHKKKKHTYDMVKTCVQFYNVSFYFIR